MSITIEYLKAILENRYAKFDQPEKQLLMDINFIEIMNALFESGDEDMKRLSKRVRELRPV